MAISKKIKAGWERRLPEITGSWTHWRLLGDGQPLADVPGDDVLGALRVVEEHFGTFKSIKATRVRMDADGRVTWDAKAEFEISNHKIDVRTQERKDPR